MTKVNKSYLSRQLKGLSLKQLSVAAGLCLLPFSAGPVWAQNDGHLITMKDVDISAFIEDVGLVTGKTFIIDPRVQGKVNIASEQKLTKGEVFQVFKNVMRVNNYAIIPDGNNGYRITLTQNSAQDAPLAFKDGVNGQMSTIILKVANVDAGEAAKLIRPVVHSQGRLSANPGGRVIIITDFPENIAKARAIVDAVDQDNEIYETINLTHLSVLEAESALKAVQGPRPDVRIVGVPATNSLVLQGSFSGIAKLKPVLNSLDRPSFKKRDKLSTVPLRFANGQELLTLLSGLLPGYAVEGQPQPTVAHDPGSNTLVISASPDVQDEIAALIRQLDQRRPQVLVEALIVEISDSTARELGVQFGVAGTDGTDIPLVTTNFSRSAPSLLALTGALAGPGLGLGDTVQGSLETSAVDSLLGLSGGSLGFASRGNDAVFSAIINAVESDTDSNILSTPFVTTLDNVPASLLVGQEIPITTGTSLSSDSASIFSTTERKEVGIKLEVLPSINEGDTIRLEIKQEVSSLAGVLSTTSTTDPITNQRDIETTVLADNGEIIVLGGLLQDDEQISSEKVPLLGDIPVLGNLFKSEGKSRGKTNLMVFIRPTIIRSAADARPLTQRRLDQVRRSDIELSGRETSKIDDFWLEP
ncbi:MAG: type II secretion system secretin GspD [Maricaulaceae bacterium]